MFRTLLMAGGVGGPGYVPGMLMHLDGIDNVGAGSPDPSAEFWKDLTGNGFDAVPRERYGNPPLWSENGGLLGDGDSRILKIADDLSPLAGCSEFTIELAYDFPSSGTAWWLNTREPWNDSDTTGIQFATYGSTEIGVSWWNGPNGAEGEIAVPSATSCHTLAFTYANGVAAVYADGSPVASTEVRLTSEQIGSTPFYINGAGALGAFSMSDGFRILGVRVYPRALGSGDLAKNSAIDMERYFN